MSWVSAPRFRDIKCAGDLKLVFEFLTRFGELLLMLMLGEHDVGVVVCDAFGGDGQTCEPARVLHAFEWTICVRSICVFDPSTALDCCLALPFEQVKPAHERVLEVPSLNFFVLCALQITKMFGSTALASFESHFLCHS